MRKYFKIIFIFSFGGVVEALQQATSCGLLTCLVWQWHREGCLPSLLFKRSVYQTVCFEMGLRSTLWESFPWGPERLRSKANCDPTGIFPPPSWKRSGADPSLNGERAAAERQTINIPTGPKSRASEVGLVFWRTIEYEFGAGRLRKITQQSKWKIWQNCGRI